MCKHSLPLPQLLRMVGCEGFVHKLGWIYRSQVVHIFEALLPPESLVGHSPRLSIEMLSGIKQILSSDAINARCLMLAQPVQGLSDICCACAVMQVF